jgi:anti-sigma factor RsiW
MNRHLDETRINDLVDDVMAVPERRQADAHIAACAECRESVLRIRALRADLALLPRDIAPPARVLAGVRAQMAAADILTHGAAGRAARWYSRPSVLAAAAVVLVALSSAATASWLRLTSDPAEAGVAAGADAPPLTATNGPGTGLVAVHAMEKSYEDAIAEVQRALSEQQSDLSPETLRILQANIDIIDRALGEARAALHADPANGALAEMLRSGYERKLDVLRSASSHTRARS